MVEKAKDIQGHYGDIVTVHLHRERCLDDKYNLINPPSPSQHLTEKFAQFDKKTRDYFTKGSANRISNAANIGPNTAKSGFFGSLFKKKGISPSSTWDSQTTSTQLFGYDTSTPFPMVYAMTNYYNPLLNFTTTAGFYNAYLNVAPVKNAVDYIARNLTQFKIHFERETQEIVNGKRVKDVESVSPEEYVSKNNIKTAEDHISMVNHILNNPNPIAQKTKGGFLYSSAFELLTTGNCFWMVEYEKFSDPTSPNNKIRTLRVVKTSEITQYGFYQSLQNGFYVPYFMFVGYSIANINGMIFRPPLDKNGIPQMDGEGQIRYFSEREGTTYELYYTTYGIGNTIIGFSPIFACANQVVTYYSCAIFEKSFFENGGSPALLMQLKRRDEEDKVTTVSDNDNAVQDLAQKKLKGEKNAGRVLVNTNLDIEYDIKPLTSFIKDVDTKSVMEKAAGEIYKVFGVPPVMFGESKWKDNIENDRNRVFEDTILPLADLIIQNLNKFLIYTNPLARRDGYFLTYAREELDIFREKDKKDALELFKEGIITLNEARQRMGMEGIGMDGDVCYREPNVIPIGKDTIFADSYSIDTAQEETS